MENGEVVREMTLSDGSQMTLRWVLFQQGSGTTVTISTDAITLNIYEVWVVCVVHDLHHTYSGPVQNYNTELLCM